MKLNARDARVEPGDNLSINQKHAFSLVIPPVVYLFIVSLSKLFKYRGEEIYNAVAIMSG